MQKVLITKAFGKSAKRFFKISLSMIQGIVSIKSQKSSTFFCKTAEKEDIF